MVDAFETGYAESINVVMPYYGYASSTCDRKVRAREPITSKLVANMLKLSGIMLTIDLHAAQIQGFFDIPVDHLMGAP